MTTITPQIVTVSNTDQKALLALALAAIKNLKGKSFTAMTAAEKNLMLAALLYKHGMLDASGKGTGTV
jgi:hypothetical protein